MNDGNCWWDVGGSGDVSGNELWGERAGDKKWEEGDGEEFRLEGEGWLTWKWWLDRWRRW